MAFLFFFDFRTEQKAAIDMENDKSPIIVMNVNKTNIYSWAISSSQFLFPYTVFESFSLNLCKVIVS